MNKQLFLNQLRIQLRGLQETEIEDIVQDYAEYFADARNNGMSEEEAAANLGNPFDIARDIKSSYEKPSHPSSSNTSEVRSFIIAAGLILFNLMIVLGPALGLIGAFFGIIFSCFVLILSPILVTGSLLFGTGHLFELFLSLFLCGIGILAMPYLLKLARKGVDWINQYLQWNIRLVKGEAP